MVDAVALTTVLSDAGFELENLGALLREEGEPSPAWIHDLRSGASAILTPAEYVELSDVTGLDVSVLTGEVEPSANFAIAMRARSGDGPTAALPRATDLLRVMAAIRSLGVDSGEQLERVRRLVDPDGLGRPNATRQQGRLAARFVRRVLGLGRGAIGDLSAVIETFGVPVEVSPLLPDGHHGFTAWNQTRAGWSAVMLVNAHDLWTVQRYTQAHELAHVVFEDRPEDLTTEVTEDISEKIASNAAEGRAEAFAAELLIPEAGLIEYWKSIAAIRSDRTSRVASVMWHFGVSRITACIALEGAGAIEWSPGDSEAVARIPIASLVGSAGLGDAWEEMHVASAAWRPSIWLLDRTSALFQDAQLPVENYALAADIEPQDALEWLLG